MENDTKNPPPSPPNPPVPPPGDDDLSKRDHGDGIEPQPDPNNPQE